MANKPSEIESIRKIFESLQQFADIEAQLPALRPLLESLGVDVDGIADTLRSTAALREQAAELANTLDRFNELFAPRGWIAYDRLDPVIARTAVATADAGDLLSAEQQMAQYYTSDEVETQLKTLWGVAAFRPRMRLAELAVVDYRECRYHACIPVVLALLDGMVNDLGNQSFFSQNVDLTAWDSIAAYDKGLAELQRLFFKQRAKTVTDPIELPYRNGILHGMDLGYDTQLVAAKCWAALFAAADWARQVEQGKKNAPPPEPESTWQEVLAKVQANQEMKRALDDWRPRERVDNDNPISGSPEAALIEFLNAWKSRNFGLMAKRLSPNDRQTLSARAGRVREFFKSLELLEFTLEAPCDQAAAVSEITVRGRGLQYGEGFDCLGKFRIVHLDQSGQPVIHGQPGGTWFVMTWNPWQEAKS